MTTDTLTKPAPKASPARKRRPLRKIDAAMRKRIEQAIEAMIEALDAIEAPGEDREPEEEGDELEVSEGDGEADDEPSLGAPEQMDQNLAWGSRFGRRDDTEIDLGSPGVTTPNDQTFEGYRFGTDEGAEEDEISGEASDLEISGEADGDNGGCVDDEPSLGSLDRRMSQLRWGLPDRRTAWLNHDIEHDDADCAAGERDDADDEYGIEDVPHD
jgi:hypothetical protein